jgi:hypothetical protein
MLRRYCGSALTLERISATGIGADGVMPFMNCNFNSGINGRC